MANKTVMIVDNDKDFLDELSDVLSSAGYNMIDINDSMQVMDVVAKNHIDLIFLDLQMPGKNGFDLAIELKNSHQFHNIPIIAMTGFNKEELHSLLNLCGVRKCLRKPFYPLDIISEIEEVFSSHKPVANQEGGWSPCREQVLLNNVT